MANASLNNSAERISGVYRRGDGRARPNAMGSRSIGVDLRGFKSHSPHLFRAKSMSKKEGWSNSKRLKSFADTTHS